VQLVLRHFAHTVHQTTLSNNTIFDPLLCVTVAATAKGKGSFVSHPDPFGQSIGKSGDRRQRNDERAASSVQEGNSAGPL